MANTRRAGVAVVVGTPEEFNEESHRFYFFDARGEDLQTLEDAVQSYNATHLGETAYFYSFAEHMLAEFGAASEDELDEQMTESTVESTDLRGVLKGLL